MRHNALIAAAAPYALSAVTGTVGSVGMAGLTLGGGYGPLSGRFGLAVDNLLSAALVLVDGTHVCKATLNNGISEKHIDGIVAAMRPRP